MHAAAMSSSSDDAHLAPVDEKMIDFAIRELIALAGRLGAVLDAEADVSQWQKGTMEVADLYERALADLGTLAAERVRLMIEKRRST